MRWFGWRPCVTRLLPLLLWPVMVAVVVMSIALFFMTPRTRALTGLTRLRLLDRVVRLAAADELKKKRPPKRSENIASRRTCTRFYVNAN